MHVLYHVFEIFIMILIASGGFAFLPWHILLLLGIHRIKQAEQKLGSLHDPAFIFQITTIGTNPKSTQAVIDSVHKSVSGHPYQVWVITEPGDPHEYKQAEKIIVPEDYETPNGSTDKTRALHYSCVLRRERGLASTSRWVIFLDDDTKMTKAYFNEILKMDPNSVGAQGMVSVRNDYGTHLFSSLADNIRPSDCIAFCSLSNTRGSPLVTHGEGLVVRSDIESQIGWDYGDILSEDFVFGRRIAQRYSGRFEWLNASIEGKSALSAGDFVKQRRRWFWGALGSFPLVSRKVALFLVLRYAVTFFGMMSLTLGFASYFLPFIPGLPYPLSMILMMNVFGIMSYYQVGCYYNTRHLQPWERVKYHFFALILQYPVYFYEIGGFLCGFLQGRPNKFQVIDKN